MKDLPQDIRDTYFQHLLLLASADRELSEPEGKSLAWYATKWDVSNSEALEPATPNQWPEDPEVAAGWLYDMCELSIADEVLSGSEKKILEAAADKLGFKSQAVMVLLQAIVEGNRMGLEDEEVESRARTQAMAYRR